MPSPTDLAYLHRLCKGNRLRMAEYVALYLQEAPGLFTRLEATRHDGNGEQLAKAAHSVRPHVHYMGAQQLLNALTLLQERASTEGAAACANLVQECLALNEDLMQALRNWQHIKAPPENG